MLLPDSHTKYMGTYACVPPVGTPNNQSGIQLWRRGTACRMRCRSISSKLISHLTVSGQFNPWQRAYLPKKEAGEHLHRLALEAKTAISHGWTTGAIFLDFEKAFDHCKVKRREAERRINLLRRLRGTDWGCTSETLLHLYKSFIRPVLETGFPVTVHATKAAVNQLQVTQNKALRVALKVYYVPGQSRVTTAELHQRSNLEPIESRLITLNNKALLRYQSSPLLPQLNDRLTRIRRLPFPLSRKIR